MEITGKRPTKKTETNPAKLAISSKTKNTIISQAPPDRRSGGGFGAKGGKSSAKDLIRL